jgi:cyclin A
MRTILVDWLVEVAEEYRLHTETLYLCVDLIDKSLSKLDVKRSELQLLGCACMLLAAKYEEIWPPTVDDFVYISDNTYTRDQVLEMEQKVLKELKFCITFPTMKHFLNRFVEASLLNANYGGTTDPDVISAAATVRAAHTNGGKCDYTKDGTWSQPIALLNYARTRGIGYEKKNVESAEETERKTKELKMTMYISELALLHFNMLKFPPSLKASSAIFLARATLNPTRQPWNATLEYYSGYSTADMKLCVTKMHAHHLNAVKEKLQAIREKYSHTKTANVGRIDPLSVLPSM